MMSTYLIGDIHGCFAELEELLNQVSFNPQCDHLWLTGDLVGRGPSSLEVLRFVYSLGKSVHCVLGNHDVHLLAAYASINYNKPKDRFSTLLQAPDADELMHWLRYQPMLQIDNKLKLVMAHAGITPQWDMKTAEMCAHELEEVLRSSKSNRLFLDVMRGDALNDWGLVSSLQDRLRFSMSALTRMRYCFSSGVLDMIYKDAPSTAPISLKPWFALPRLIDDRYTIIFGHWASLSGKDTPSGIIGLDTGCCWGGHLTMLRWEDHRYFTQPAKNSTSL